MYRKAFFLFFLILYLLKTTSNILRLFHLDLISHTDKWLNDVEGMRLASDKAQAKANEKMVAYNLKKKRISEYKVGEEVLIRNPKAKNKNGKNVVTEFPSFTGTVIEVNNLNYKVQYTTDVGASLTDWSSVSSVTSTTKEEERQRKQVSVIEKHPISDVTTVGIDNSMMTLSERLSLWDLSPVETSKDGNCFFRAISQSIYGTETCHYLIRRQAIERVLDHPEDYQAFLLHEHTSVDKYVSHMQRDGTWADDDIVRATADAMDVEIQVITSMNDYVPVIPPQSGNPTQTIFLGQITDFHFMATESRREPRQIMTGGITSNGIQILNSSSFDVCMTWFYNLLTVYVDSFRNIINLFPIIGETYKLFKKCNSADLKKYWLERFNKRKFSLYTRDISFELLTDMNVLKNTLPHEFNIEKHTAHRTKKQCSENSSEHHLISTISLRNLRNILSTNNCPTC